MKRYYVIQDGKIIASSSTMEAAINIIERYMATDKHWMKPEYSVIFGEQTFYKRKGGK